MLLDVRALSANRPLEADSFANESLRGRSYLPMDAVGEREQAHAVRRQNLVALRAADRQKDEFIAVLAHELRSPLAPIRTAAAILTQPCVDAATSERARAVIDRQVKDMARLIDELLDVARITQGKMSLEISRVDLAEVLRRTLEIVDEPIAHRKQELLVSLPAEACYVRGDSTRLQQVFSNLLNNASKFSRQGGCIRLSAEKTVAGDVLVLVQDDGIGIAADKLAHVFDLFKQAGESPHRSRGLGVGLALVRRIVEFHGGHVRAESAGADRGSRFIVSLPLLEVSPSRVLFGTV